mmetsp:Transcript_63365/g.136273  ORF Transcript_63365/g.136273 Transcript_63365/m.136273 type:complete len:297 (-) Transcript_63365:1187-2077(-)
MPALAPRSAVVVLGLVHHAETRAQWIYSFAVLLRSCTHAGLHGDRPKLLAAALQYLALLLHVNDQLLDVPRRVKHLVSVLLLARPHFGTAEGRHVLPILGARAPGQVEGDDLPASRVALASALQAAHCRRHPLPLEINLFLAVGDIEEELHLLLLVFRLPPGASLHVLGILVLAHPSLPKLRCAHPPRCVLSGRFLRKQLCEGDHRILVGVEKLEEIPVPPQAGDILPRHTHTLHTVGELLRADVPAAIEIDLFERLPRTLRGSDQLRPDDGAVVLLQFFFREVLCRWHLLHRRRW